MGGFLQDVEIPHRVIMRKNLRLQGKWMYERSDVADMFKLVEGGMLKLGADGGAETVGEYPLEQWRESMGCSVGQRVDGTARADEAVIY